MFHHAPEHDLDVSEWTSASRTIFWARPIRRSFTERLRGKIRAADGRWKFFTWDMNYINFGYRNESVVALPNLLKTGSDHHSDSTVKVTFVSYGDNFIVITLPTTVVLFLVAKPSSDSRSEGSCTNKRNSTNSWRHVRTMKAAVTWRKTFLVIWTPQGHSARIQKIETHVKRTL